LVMKNKTDSEEHKNIIFSPTRKDRWSNENKQNKCNKRGRYWRVFLVSRI
jgi:hypothetical protein